MNRPILDPAQAAGAEESPRIERLPARVAAFGFFPDLAPLQPGDLILVRATRASTNVRAIEAAQRRSHPEEDAQWIHAAAYLGDGGLVEIDQGGVSVNELHKYVGEHRLLFRRPLALSGEPVGPPDGFRIAIAALKMFKTSYDVGGLLTIARQALRSQADYALHPRSRTAICSDYYNDAVARVLGRGAVSAKINPFTPADLSASSYMRDVPTRWLRLPR